MALRVDVRYMKPDGYREVGLVDYAEDEDPSTPTLFVGAYIRSKEDKEWFEKTVKELTTEKS